MSKDQGTHSVRITHAESSEQHIRRHRAEGCRPARCQRNVKTSSRKLHDRPTPLNCLRNVTCDEWLGNRDRRRRAEVRLFVAQVDIRNNRGWEACMGLQVSIASLLLSVVVAVPCMRKLTCLPPDKKTPAPHAVTTQAPPQAITTPSASMPEKTHHCTVHTRVAHKTASLAEHTS